MKEKVLAFNNQHSLFNKGDTLFLAVSGGPDSLALLHFFASLKPTWDFHLHTLTVDHQLRGQASKDDSQFVYEESKKLGIPCTIGTVNVNRLKEKMNKGTQEAARELRYQFFLEEMNKESNAKLVFAHHADDQVESIVMQFVKGVRQKGMPISRKMDNHTIIRPFLCLTKDEIMDYLKEHKLTPRIDLSNEDMTYTRNRFRKEIIPLIRKENPNLNDSLIDLTQQLVEEDVFLYELAEKKLNEIAFFYEQKVTFSISAITSIPLPLQRRAFHLILNYLQNKNDYNKDYFHAFSEWVKSNKPNSKTSFGNLTLIKSYDHCEIIQGKLMKLSYEEKLNLDDEITLPNGWVVKVRKATFLGEDVCKDHVFICDQSYLQFPLHIRTRKEGDRIRPLGLNGTKKVKKLFIDHKVPAHERDHWPVITNGDGEIIWLPFVCKSEIANTTGLTNIIITVDTAKE